MNYSKNIVNEINDFNFERGKFKSFIGLSLFSVFIFILIISLSSAKNIYEDCSIYGNCNEASTSTNALPPTNGSIGGSDKQVQYNDNGVFAGASQMKWDKTLEALGIATNPSSSYRLSVGGTGIQTTNLSIGTLNGILKASTGIVGVATGGIDYEVPLNFIYPLEKSGDDVSVVYASDISDGVLTSSDYSYFFSKVDNFGGTTNQVAYFSGTNEITGSNKFLFDGTNITFSGYFNGSGNFTTTGQINSSRYNAMGANTQVLFNDNGFQNSSSGLTFNKATNILTSSGNVHASQLRGSWYASSSAFAGISQGTASQADLKLQDTAGTGFRRLQFGGINSSYPSLNRNGQNFNMTLADGSALTNLTVNSIFANNICYTNGTGCSSTGVNYTNIAFTNQTNNFQTLNNFYTDNSSQASARFYGYSDGGFNTIATLEVYSNVTGKKRVTLGDDGNGLYGSIYLRGNSTNGSRLGEFFFVDDINTCEPGQCDGRVGGFYAQNDGAGYYSGWYIIDKYLYIRDTGALEWSGNQIADGSGNIYGNGIQGATDMFYVCTAKQPTWYDTDGDSLSDTYAEYCTSWSQAVFNGGIFTGYN